MCDPLSPLLITAHSTGYIVCLFLNVSANPSSVFYSLFLNDRLEARELALQGQHPRVQVDDCRFWVSLQLLVSITITLLLDLDRGAQRTSFHDSDFFFALLAMLAPIAFQRPWILRTKC